MESQSSNSNPNKEILVPLTMNVDILPPIDDSNIDKRYISNVDYFSTVFSRPKAKFSVHCNCISDRAAKWLRIVAFVTIAVTACSIFTLYFVSEDVQSFCMEIFAYITSLDVALGSLLMVMVYAVSLLLLLPGTPFNLACGFLFGFGTGSVVSLVGLQTGAFIAYLLGKTILRAWAKAKIHGHKKFEAIDWALQKRGLYIVFLTRLSPLMPFPLLNYAFGATRISWYVYFIGTLLGSAPSTIGYTYLGTAMRSIAEMWNDNELEDNLYWIVACILVSLACVVLVTYITKRAIDNATEEYEASKLGGETSSLVSSPAVWLRRCFNSCTAFFNRLVTRGVY